MPVHPTYWLLLGGIAALLGLAEWHRRRSEREKLYDESRANRIRLWGQQGWED